MTYNSQVAHENYILRKGQLRIQISTYTSFHDLGLNLTLLFIDQNLSMSLKRINIVSVCQAFI